MDTAALSRRNHTMKKGNKENTQPAHGGKSVIQRDKAAPLQPKGSKKKEILATEDPLKAKVNQADLRSVSSAAQKKVKTAQRDADVQRQTHSRAFRTDQAAKFKKVAAEALKPPAPVPPVKSAPGMYKGKIVQSKIGSIWKSSSTMSVPDLKPETESRRVGMTKSRSKSVSEVSERESRKAAQARSKSVFDRNAQATKTSASSRPPAQFYSARPPARTVPATLAATSSRNVVPPQAGASQSSKPKTSAGDRKVNKPPVSSTLSQYRLTMETAEERRAKLSEWLASKGKTLKRPAMTTAAAPPNTKTNAKPEAHVKAQGRSEVAQPAARREPAPERSLGAHEPDAAAQCAEPTVHSNTSLVVNTSLELLESSDTSLSVSPQEEMDDIVVNLCDALEALATPSGCSDECPQETDECSDAGMECSGPEGDCRKELSEDVVEEEESDVQKVKREDEEEEEEECEVEDAMKTPEAEDASVIKYSVKTTPYLQSVKKTLADEASASTSKRKGNIKDLKFLTPVRRSCRIERKSSRLPPMLVEQDPCVSSLAELVKLDDDANAYIYRKNTALLEELPDQPRL